jgi:kynurenine formamidase
MNVYHDDFVAADLGQVGTQFDGLGHIGIQQGPDGDKSQMRYYNGFTELDLYSRTGLQRLGVENVPPIFTTGFLVDIAGLKGRMLEGGEEISLQDVRDALQRQSINENQIEPGSAILFNTGYGSLWGVDNDSYGNSSPGIGVEVAEWLVEKQVVVAGSDTFALEVVPNPDPDLAFPVHAILLTRNGTYLQENLDLSELVADGVDKFAYIYVRVPITGATGSPGSPIAVK